MNCSVCAALPKTWCFIGFKTSSKQTWFSLVQCVFFNLHLRDVICENIIEGKSGFFSGCEHKEGTQTLPKWKQRCEFALQRWQVHCRTTKGNLLRLGTCHQHNSRGRKGYSELMFILMLFVSLLKQLPGLFWPQVLIPKRRLSANTTCMVEHTTSHGCHWVTFLSFIMWKCGCLHSQPTGCQALQMAGTCVHNTHIL